MAIDYCELSQDSKVIRDHLVDPHGSCELAKEIARKTGRPVKLRAFWYDGDISSQVYYPDGNREFLGTTSI